MTDCYISKSNIHGKGLFCESILYKGDHIVSALDLKKYKVLPLCKFINHAWEKNANTKLELCGEDGNTMCLVAKKKILPGIELTINYNGKNVPDWIVPADNNWK